MPIKYSGSPTQAGEESIETDLGTLRISVVKPYIIFNGTPTHAGTADIQTDKGILHVIVENTIDPEGLCYLFLVNEDGESIQLNLPNVQSIEETNTANITEISTIIYGFDDNFVMDVGTTQRYTVTVKRVQPMDCRDDDDWEHQHQWSNGHWFRMLQVFFKDWQNLNSDGHGIRKGGYTFHYEPSPIRDVENASDLYPEITENVFLAGSLTASYKDVQTLTISFPLAVSDMKPDRQDQNLRDVLFKPGEVSILSSFINKYPEGINTIMPGIPLSWSTKSMGRRFKWWSDGSGTYDQGTRGPADVDEFTALWDHPIAFEYVGLDTVEHIEGKIPSNTRTIAYWIIGWGGAGGLNISDGDGGGGGTGAYISNRLGVGEYKSFKIFAGTNNSYRDARKYQAYLSLSKIETYSASGAFKIMANRGSNGGSGNGSAKQGLGGSGGSPNGVAGKNGADGGVGGSLGEVLDGFGMLSTKRVSTGEAETLGPFDKSDIDSMPEFFGHGGNNYDLFGSSTRGKSFVMVAFYE